MTLSKFKALLQESYFGYLLNQVNQPESTEHYMNFKSLSKYSIQPSAIQRNLQSNIIRCSTPYTCDKKAIYKIICHLLFRELNRTLFNRVACLLCRLQ